MANLSNDRFSLKTYYSNIDYEFDYHLQILDVRLSHSFRQLYNNAVMDGLIAHEYNENELKKNLSENIVYFDGENWTSTPAMSNSW